MYRLKRQTRLPGTRKWVNFHHVTRPDPTQIIGPAQPNVYQSLFDLTVPTEVSVLPLCSSVNHV